MLAVIHHINSPKLKPYPSGVIEMAKNKIRQKPDICEQNDFP